MPVSQAPAVLPLRSGSLAPAPADQKPKEPHQLSVSEAALQREANVLGPHPLHHRAVYECFGTWLCSCKGLQEPFRATACAVAGEGPSPLHQICSASVVPSGIAQNGPSLGSLFPRLSCALHRAIRVSSEAGLGADSPSPRQCHNLCCSP